MRGIASRHRGGGWTAADLRTDAREKLAVAERLGDIVVGARVEPGDLVDLVAARREHNDRHVRASPQAAGDLDSAQVG